MSISNFKLGLQLILVVRSRVLKTSLSESVGGTFKANLSFDLVSGLWTLNSA